MKSRRPHPAWLALIPLTLCLCSVSLAEEGLQKSTETPPPPSASLIAQADAQGQGARDHATREGQSCEVLEQAISTSTGPDRPDLAKAALRKPCRPMPGIIWSAIGSGKWSSGQALEPADRIGLLATAVQSRYPEAETLLISVLQEGAWADSSSISLDEGSSLIRAAKPALSPYRIHLLMDIYEQREEPVVRSAVLETLKDAPTPEALLPALAAYYEETGQIQQAGLSNLHTQPEKTPPEVLLRLIKTLPAGPSYEWAKRLGTHHSSTQIEAAIQAREGSPKNPKKR